jgi:DNA ligase 4
MLPTPAPTSPPGSPEPLAVTTDEDGTYPPPPQTVGSAPFHILVGLFEKLQTERKPERRRKLLDAWFNV